MNPMEKIKLGFTTTVPKQVAAAQFLIDVMKSNVIISK